MSKFDDKPRRRKTRERKPLTKKDLDIDTREGRVGLKYSFLRKDLRENRLFKGAGRHGLLYMNKQPKKTAIEKEKELTLRLKKRQADYELLMIERSKERERAKLKAIKENSKK